MYMYHLNGKTLMVFCLKIQQGLGLSPALSENHTTTFLPRVLDVKRILSPKCLAYGMLEVFSLNSGFEPETKLVLHSTLFNY